MLMICNFYVAVLRDIKLKRYTKIMCLLYWLSVYPLSSDAIFAIKHTESPLLQPWPLKLTFFVVFTNLEQDR